MKESNSRVPSPTLSFCCCLLSRSPGRRFGKAVRHPHDPTRGVHRGGQRNRSAQARRARGREHSDFRGKGTFSLSKDGGLPGRRFQERMARNKDEVEGSLVRLSGNSIGFASRVRQGSLLAHSRFWRSEDGGSGVTDTIRIQTSRRHQSSDPGGRRLRAKIQILIIQNRTS